MKFVTIEVENLFTYQGRVTLDVSGTTPEKNLILVWGRNGKGKTSLLNSIKLLFLGAEDKSLRSLGFPARTLGARQFVLGDGAGWSGIINKHARKSDPEARARVRVVWENDGQIVSAERQWIPTTAGYRETITVDDGEFRLTDQAAEERLSDFLPRDFVPLFFFDGEEIKSLAETEGRKAVDFDKVLRISFVTDVADELKEIAKERQRELLPEEVRLQITEVEGEISKAKAVQDAAKQQIITIEEQLVDKRTQRRQLQARRENLKSGATSAQREELETQRDEYTRLFGEQVAEVNKLLPAVAPMVGNPALVKATIDELSKRTSATGGSDQLIVKRIQENLKKWLREGPPTLHQKTADEVAKTLSDRMTKLVDAPEPTGVFAPLDISRAFQIRDALIRFAGPDQRRSHSQLLQMARRTRIELERVKEALMQLEVGSQATIEEYKELTTKLEQLDDEISTLDQDLGQQQRRFEDAAELERQAHSKLRDLERVHGQAEQRFVDAQYIQRLARTLNDLREELRKSMRERVQHLVNEKFKVLVHDHNLVQEVELDDAYTLTFRDERGDLVGRSSLSSGLRQLAATALLWAMKEVPGHDVPVIIDTPLGRIDRENQDNMLQNYYPNLASQVLVFPTNAEIDHRKYSLISSRVAKEYKIVNDSGESAEIRPGSLIN